MNVHLVMFMTPLKYGKDNYYANSVRNLIDSAKQYGIEQFHVYSPEMLDVDESTLQYMKDNEDPGFGFYMWKPLVILDVMKKIKDGDVVLYHDAGRLEYNFGFRKDVNYLIKEVIDNYKGIGIAHGSYKHHQYCKQDCFIEMGCNEEKYWNLNHLSATWSIWEKNPLAIEILNEWKYYCSNPFIISSNDKSDVLSAFDNFQGHRHDQAILTNIFYKHHFKDNIIRPLSSNRGWEKDINNFVDIHYVNSDPSLDYSLIKNPNIYNTKNNITLILDVFYKNDKLHVLVTGGVHNVYLIKDTNVLESTKTDDPHRNIYLFTFDTEYTDTVKLKIDCDRDIDEFIEFNITKDYYGDYSNKGLISVICNGFHNNVTSVLTFVKYHINLGFDAIVIHYRDGNNIREFYNALRSYIEDKKVILVDWNGKIEFYQEIRIGEFAVGLGEVAHLNHALHVFKNSKYLSHMNMDQLMAPPKGTKNIKAYLDFLVINNDAQDKGGFLLRLVDFKKPDDLVEYYKTTEVINNTSPFPELIYFPQNVNMASNHCITSGKPEVELSREILPINHYPFLDNNRRNDMEVIGYSDRIDYSLIEN